MWRAPPVAGGLFFWPSEERLIKRLPESLISDADAQNRADAQFLNRRNLAPKDEDIRRHRERKLVHERDQNLMDRLVGDPEVGDIVALGRKEV